MIAVCIIGVLASVGASALSRYVMESRATEVTIILGTMYKQAAAYFEKPLAERGIVATTSGRCVIHDCCAPWPSPNAMIPPFPPSSEKRLVDLNTMDTEGSMKHTGVGPSGWVYGSYAWDVQAVVENRCGVTEADMGGDPLVYIFTGALDLNDNGIYGGGGLEVGIRGEQLFRAPALVSTKEVYRRGDLATECPFCSDNLAD